MSDDECELCGGEGEVWTDVEMPNGKVLEDCRPCRCGGGV